MRGELGELVEVGVESKCKRRWGWEVGGGQREVSVVEARAVRRWGQI